MLLKIEHLGIAVDNLKDSHQSPKPGADQKLIAFLHPKSSDKLLVELCQDVRP